MAYHPLPVGTRLSNEQFIDEMNKAIRDDDMFREGMAVIPEDDGYILEYDGEILEDPHSRGILSNARKKVLG
jgi:hypothetical protein